MPVAATMLKAIAALALFESVSAFQAPLAAKSVRAAPQMFSEGDIGVLPPLGVYDPLGLIETRNMARYEVMEIKHGRAAMLGFVHVLLIEAGARFPGYLSPSQGASPPPHCRSICAASAALYSGSVRHSALLMAVFVFGSGLKFSDVPAGCFASLEALPTAGWLQIMLTTCMMETGK